MSNFNKEKTFIKLQEAKLINEYMKEDLKIIQKEVHTTRSAE